MATPSRANFDEQPETVSVGRISIFSSQGPRLRHAVGRLPKTLITSELSIALLFITDVRYGDRLTQIRREVFGDNFPGSALITITALAVPDAKIEIQGYAVIGGK